MLNKEDKRIPHHHSVLGWIIALLLGLILIVFVFKVGMMVGSSKSYFSSYSKKDYSHKKISGHMGNKFSSLKKSAYFNKTAYFNKSAYSTYKGVVKLTDTGFVTKDADGNIEEVVINEETKIISGKEAADRGVSVGDKVYIEGSVNGEGQVEASLIKIYDAVLSEVKK